MVLDIKFMHGTPQPTLLVLYEDNRTARHLKTYNVQLKEKDFGESSPWPQQTVDSGAHMIIPVCAPLGGAIIVGETSLTYFNGEHMHQIPLSKGLFLDCF